MERKKQTQQLRPLIDMLRTYLLYCSSSKPSFCHHRECDAQYGTCSHFSRLSIGSSKPAVSLATSASNQGP